jgi:biotin carboxyl carrier protein
MMDARTPYSKVQSVYDDMKAKGFLDERAMDTLGKMVKTYSEQENTRTAVTQNLSDAVRASQGQATSSTGTPDYQFPIKGGTTTAMPYDAELGGVTVNIPQGSSIQAPASGTVTQAGKDADGNFAMKIQHADGSVTAFTGLTAANVKVGDQVERGETIATSGAADQKTPSVLWSLTNAAGTNVDPTKAGLAPVDLTKVTDEKVLGAALDSMRKQVTDPYLQQQATSEMELMVRHNQQMATAGQAQVFKQASDAFYSGGMNWRSIPPSVFNQLPPERQQQFKDAQTEEVLKNYHQGQAFKEMGETDQVANFFQNPDQLTQANVDAARANLSNSTYLQLSAKATELANNPKGVVEAQAVNDSIKFYAGHSGVNVEPKTQADKQTMNDLTVRVNNDINQIKTQNHGKATQEQVNQVIQNELIQRTLSVPRSAWNPLSITGISPNSSTKKFNFQMPAGATSVAPGSDGKMYYTDGKTNLGPVQ